MSRRVATVTPSLPASPAVCGDCGKAYGFCRPAWDGRPVFCRCPRFPDRYLLVSSPACGELSPRAEPAPDRVTERDSDNPYAGMIPVKVVPLFRSGDPLPYAVVPVDMIPPGGITPEFISSLPEHVFTHQNKV